MSDPCALRSDLNCDILAAESGGRRRRSRGRHRSRWRLSSGSLLRLCSRSRSRSRHHRRLGLSPQVIAVQRTLRNVPLQRLQVGKPASAQRAGRRTSTRARSGQRRARHWRRHDTRSSRLGKQLSPHSSGARTPLRLFLSHGSRTMHAHARPSCSAHSESQPRPLAVGGGTMLRGWSDYRRGSGGDRGSSSHPIRGSCCRAHRSAGAEHGRGAGVGSVQPELRLQ